MRKRRIIIIDDEPLISGLIKELIEEEPDLEVAQVARSKEEFFEKILQDKFDLALVDISLGERQGGFDLLREFKGQGIELPAIMLSAHSEKDYALKCLNNGAKGYINKMHILSDLVNASREILNGGFFVSSNEGDTILKEYRKSISTP